MSGMISSLTAVSEADRPKLASSPSIERPSPSAKRAQAVSASARMRRYALTGPGIGAPNADQAMPTRVERTMGLRMTRRANLAGSMPKPRALFGSSSCKTVWFELLQDHRARKHHNRDKDRCDRRRQDRARSIGRL